MSAREARNIHTKNKETKILFITKKNSSILSNIFCLAPNKHFYTIFSLGPLFIRDRLKKIECATWCCDFLHFLRDLQIYFSPVVFWSKFSFYYVCKGEIGKFFHAYVLSLLSSTCAYGKIFVFTFLQKKNFACFLMWFSPNYLFSEENRISGIIM